MAGHHLVYRARFFCCSNLNQDPQPIHDFSYISVLSYFTPAGNDVFFLSV